MLSYAGYQAREPRGYDALGTGDLNRFYKASDRWFFLALADGDRSRLRHVVGLETDRPLDEQFSRAPAAVWVARLREQGIAAQVRVPVAELMADADVRRRGLSVTQVVPEVGETTAPGLPVRLSRTPMRLGEPPHRPGADASAILADVGLADELSTLEHAWVLQVNDLPPAW
jgi:crotonobetainyl-CoA:carnitine CoA-transferase CaiB-like acyl-CoA transferase